mgnify:CR=1 FL=1
MPDFVCTWFPDVWFGISITCCCITHDLVAQTTAAHWDLMLCVIGQLGWLGVPVGGAMFIGLVGPPGMIYRALKKNTARQYGAPLEELNMRKIDTLVIHCSATPEGRAVSVETIRGWHMKKGWRDIGYHFVIGLDGVVHRGRPLGQIGAHVKGHNTGSIGICYVGGVTNDGLLDPKDTRTPEQKAALDALLTSLCLEYPIKRILGHRDFAGVAKACPCFDAVPEYRGILERPEIKPAFQSDCEAPAAKPLIKSTTNLSAVGGALAGGASAIKAFEPWLAALIIVIIAGFAAWIIRERIKRHREYGE